MKSAIICVLGIMCLSSWGYLQKNPIQYANWLIGTWENKNAKGSIFETWQQISQIKLSGKSYKIKGSDTIVFENIQLVQENDDLFYVPVVHGQNDGLPVRFALKNITPEEMTFENLGHDFPQKIQYTKIGFDSLHAEISGTVSGVLRKQSFPMKKVK